MLSSVIITWATLVEVEWDFIVALIWISLMTSDVERLFIPFLARHILWCVCSNFVPIFKLDYLSSKNCFKEFRSLWVLVNAFLCGGIHFRKEQSWEIMSLLSQVGCTVRRMVRTARQWRTDTRGRVQTQDPVMKMAASRERDGLHFYLFIYFCYGIQAWVPLELRDSKLFFFLDRSSSKIT